jgi:sugar lactone lactonase YvrE
MSAEVRFRLLLSILIVLAAVVYPQWCRGQAPADYSVSTLAGNGVPGISGDNGRASEAQLNFPMGVAVDANGNVYIADQLNARIRRVAIDGTISTVAGNGSGGYSGDGGSATNAGLLTPCGVVVDRNGNLFIADTRNHRVRRVTPGGTITTVAGNGTAAYAGDGAEAIGASLNVPVALALDSAGNLYIADAFNSAIRKVTFDGKIWTVAGRGIPGFSGDGGSATAASLNQPGGITVDATDNLYIADSSNHRIRKVTTDGVITTVAGGPRRGFSGDGGVATGASLNYPRGIALDSLGRLYITDSLNNRIRALLPDGTILTIAGAGFGDYGDGGPALEARFRFPEGLAIDNAGALYVADNQNSRIRVLRPLPEVRDLPAPTASLELAAQK